MKARYLSTLMMVMLLSWSCTEKEDSDDTIKPAAPSWSAGSPAVFYGATSVDVELETDRDCHVYYYLSEEDLNLTPDDLITRTAEPGRLSVAGRGAATAGVVTLKGKSPSTITIPSLREQEKYFIYLLCENTTDSLHADQVEKLEFKTHIRQDTLQFSSQAENRNVSYLLYQPEEALKYPDKKYPIAFFLGGYGERAGDENTIAIIKNGLLPEYIHLGNDVPMIVASIQHIKKDWDVELVREGMEHVMENFPGDEKRTYLIGTSGGAFGTWEFAQRYPERLAAIVPISGGGEVEQACRLKNMAVWAFHNERDDLIHTGKSVSMIDAIKSCGGEKEASLFLFPDAGHNCWKRVFDPQHADWAKSPSVERIQLYDWLMRQSK